MGKLNREKTAKKTQKRLSSYQGEQLELNIGESLRSNVHHVPHSLWMWHKGADVLIHLFQWAIGWGLLIGGVSPPAFEITSEWQSWLQQAGEWPHRKKCKYCELEVWPLLECLNHIFWGEVQWDQAQMERGKPEKVLVVLLHSHFPGKDTASHAEPLRKHPGWSWGRGRNWNCGHTQVLWFLREGMGEAQ